MEKMSMGTVLYVLSLMYIEFALIVDHILLYNLSLYRDY